jgi:hypothetical protein
MQGRLARADCVRTPLRNSALRFADAATRPRVGPAGGLALPQTVTVMLSDDLADYRTVTFCDPLAKSADLNVGRLATPG